MRRHGTVIISAILFATVAVIAGFAVFGSQQLLAITSTAAAISALFAAFTAFATLQLANESQKQREGQEQQRKELAFRAAIMELANNVEDFSNWRPVYPTSWRDDIWWKYPMQFPHLIELMEVVWLPPKLWERIFWRSLRVIQSLEEKMKYVTQEGSKIQGSREIYFRGYYILVLYLKQLIRYIVCEMQQENLTLPEGIWETVPLRALPWSYDDLAPSPADAARSLEYNDFASSPPEVDNPAFSRCRLETLIDESRTSFQKEQQSKSAN
jgi:hypothetical protein